MVKAQHTPGPWSVAEDARGRHWINAERFCVTGPMGDHPVEKANAHLIAAAPEMLEAIEHVLIASEDGGDFEDIDFEMLRNILAKAKGVEVNQCK